MKSNRILIAVIASVTVIAAAAITIYIFRNEIADFFVDLKARIDEKILKIQGNGEYVE